MRGQSSKTRDQSPFSKISPFIELLQKTGAEYSCDFIAPMIYEVFFHDFSTVSNHALKCGDVFCKV